MKVCGIICEYNPFHNGHLFHMNEARLKTKCDYIICVMSGNFVQRGEAAILDKWARARHALLGSADLVIELPALYALQSAESFAAGSVGILDALGVCDNLCFGAEHDDLRLLGKISRAALTDPAKYNEAILSGLSSGIQMAQANTQAIMALLSEPGADTDEIESILNNPNCILAIEYLRTLMRLNSNIKPCVIKRSQSMHGDENITGDISSANAIRKAFFDSRSIKDCLPDFVNESLNTLPSVRAHAFGQIILALIRKMPVNELSQIHGVSEGLENRIKQAAEQAGNYEDYLSSLKTKRYPLTRLQRAGINILLGMTTKKKEKLINAPLYARILGMRQSAAPLLSEIKKRSSISLISKAADYQFVLPSAAHEVFEHDILASNMYSLMLDGKYSRANRDFTEKVILL